jgi:hypothetical protein
MGFPVWRLWWGYLRRFRSWSKSRVDVKEGVPDFMAVLYLYKKQVQATKLLIYQHFLEKCVIKLSRSAQNISQLLRDKLR